MSFKRFVRDVLPVLLWLSVIFMLSTGAGGASHTNSFLDSFLSRFFPGVYHRLTWPELDAIHYYIRKAAHVTEYAILGTLMVRALCPSRPGLSQRILLISWTLCAAYAATDEFHQIFVPGRTAKVTDVLLDAAGAAIGIVVFRFLLLRRTSRSRMPGVN